MITDGRQLCNWGVAVWCKPPTPHQVAALLMPMRSRPLGSPPPTVDRVDGISRDVLHLDLGEKEIRCDRQDGVAVRRQRFRPVMRHIPRPDPRVKRSEEHTFELQS